MTQTNRTVPTLAAVAALAVAATLWAALPVAANAEDTTPVAAAPAALPAAPSPVTPATSPVMAPAVKSVVSPVSPVLPAASTGANAGGSMNSPVTVRTPLIKPNDDYLSQLAALQRQITLEEKQKELRELKVKTEQLQADYEEAVRKRRAVQEISAPAPAPKSGPGIISGIFDGLGKPSEPGTPATTTTQTPSAMPENPPVPNLTSPQVTIATPVPMPPMPTSIPTETPRASSGPSHTANVSSLRGVGDAMTADVILEDGSIMTVKAGDKIPQVGTVSKISADGVYVGGKRGGRRLPMSNSVPSSGDSMGGMPDLPMPPMSIPYTPTNAPTMPNFQVPGAGQLVGQPPIPAGGQMFDGNSGGMTPAQ